jgi:hypothetical protein
MSRLCHALVCAALVAHGAVFAQDKTGKPAGKATEVVACFHDGSVVRKAVIEGDIEILTRYGRLYVPAADVRHIEFGLRLPDEIARQVSEAIEGLGSHHFDRRQAADRQLGTLGFRAYQALQTAARGTDKEVAARAQAILERIRAKTPAEQLNVQADDVIHTADCVLCGRIVTPAFKARSAALGELSLRLAELRSLHSAAVVQANLTLEGAQFTEAGKWADTGFSVEAGAGLVVSASGQVDLVPQQAGQHVSGPDGYAGAGPNGGHLPGTLLGRIGPDGEVFVVGKHYAGKSSRAGRLYLSIVPVAGNQTTGAYQAQVRSGHALEPDVKTSAPVQASSVSVGLTTRW